MAQSWACLCSPGHSTVPSQVMLFTKLLPHLTAPESHLESSLLPPTGPHKLLVSASKSIAFPHANHPRDSMIPVDFIQTFLLCCAAPIPLHHQRTHFASWGGYLLHSEEGYPALGHILHTFQANSHLLVAQEVV